MQVMTSTDPTSYVLCLSVNVEAKEPLTEALLELGCQGLAESQTGSRVTLKAYSATRAEAVQWQRRAIALAAERQWELAQVLEQVDNSWQLSWTEALEPVQLTPNLRLVPRCAAGESRRPGDIYLKPALAFGFGEHPTTCLISRWVEAQCQTLRPRRVLDLGSGTGVLSFVALRSGAGEVVGLDIAEEAVSAASANARLNSLSDRAYFSAELPPSQHAPFDLGIANIELNGLLSVMPQMSRLLSPGAPFAVTGVLLEQVSELRERFGASGLPCTLADEQDGWALLIGKRGLLARKPSH